MRDYSSANSGWIKFTIFLTNQLLKVIVGNDIRTKSYKQNTQIVNNSTNFDWPLSRMAFNSRRMDPWSYNDTLKQFCAPHCDPSKSTKRYCPIRCYQICYKICQRSTYKISPPPLPNQSPKLSVSHSPKLSIALAICLSLLVTTFFLFTIHNYYKIWSKSRRRSQRLSQSHVDFLDQERGPTLGNPWQISTVGLEPSVINAITTCNYKIGEGLIEGTECSVCLNEFQENETLRLLPTCNHAFHLPCIDTWLSSHTNCPNCRAGIVLPDPEPAPAPELILDNSGLLQETLLGISENNGEFDRRIEQQENGLNLNEFPFQRSVSLDTLSVSVISDATGKITGTRIGKLNEWNTGINQKRNSVNKSLIKLVGSSSFGSSMQKGPILMKRSVSWSEKVSLSRHRRSQNRIRSSILPSWRFFRVLMVPMLKWDYPEFHAFYII